MASLLGWDQEQTAGLRHVSNVNQQHLLSRQKTRLFLQWHEPKLFITAYFPSLNSFAIILYGAARNSVPE